jgi:hypothetical protein
MINIWELIAHRLLKACFDCIYAPVLHEKYMKTLKLVTICHMPHANGHEDLG